MKVKYINSLTTGTILIKSDTEIKIGDDEVVAASIEVDDYYTDDSLFIDTCNNEFGRSLFFANGANNIKISGGKNSLINGYGSYWKNNKNYTRRPSIVRLVNCENVELSNLSVFDSACWAIHLLNCKNVKITNINIVSKWCGNNDGIDIDSCENVYVSNCTIDSGDDAIVLKTTKNIPCRNVIVENCKINTGWSAFKIGTESVGDFNDIIFRNNSVVKSDGCAFKIVPTDGGKVKNVLISDVDVQNATGPIFFANGNRKRVYYANNETDGISEISDVTVKNVKCNVYIGGSEVDSSNGKGVVFASGTPENKIKNLTIENCEFLMPGGETKLRTYSVDELTTQYPEYYALGPAPAFGAYMRHVDGLKMQNVKFKLKNSDIRKETVFVDVSEKQ